MGKVDELLDKTTKFANDVHGASRDAVCVCAVKGDKVLAIARRGTEDEWGLPGGKIELGEDPVEALVREVQEEAKIDLDPGKCKPVFQRTDEAGFDVITFLYDGDVDQRPKQGDAGPAKWVTWQELFDGPFGKYNMQLYEKLTSSRLMSGFQNAVKTAVEKHKLAGRIK